MSEGDDPSQRRRGGRTHAQHAAIVLAGGRGSRLGGVDKASVDIDGRMLLEHVLAAVSAASPTIVVGPPHLERPGVTVVREDPPFSGPVAGIAAALSALQQTGEAPHDDASETWLLACDLPRASSIVAQLADAPIPADRDGIALVDAAGREQWLAGRYRVRALRAAVSALPSVTDASMRRLLSGIRLHLIADRDGASVDLDTWNDIDHYRSNREDSHG
ncbi:molybdenum cofactor guanylyltransferase [Paramicrobacterium sp. CJ85]|uniref:molybdenum cofactor guanylyltransferase n=1 Tax=Paramicrobacterium sp. CJ85 TaxID=3445355 RepID=UPI003F624B1F